ncbi:MAG: hypothetical protein AAF684_01850, partial [Pseudomonadota bacterium]
RVSRPAEGRAERSMNAELRRLVWSDLTLSRIAIAAAVTGLALALGAQGDDETVAQTGGAIFALALLWATLSAANAVSGEVAARTWDGQRLSALSPTGLVIGKLIGAGALPSLIALAGVVAIAASGADNSRPVAIVAIGVLICAQAIALFLDIAAANRSGDARRGVFGGAMRAIAALAAAGVLGYAALDTLIEPTAAFGPLSLAGLWIYALWAVAGGVAATRAAFGYRDGPLVWLGFSAYVVFDAYQGWPFEALDEVFATAAWLSAVAAAAGLAYVAAFWTLRDTARLRGWLTALRAGAFARVWRLTPGWPIPLVMMAVSAAIFSVLFTPPLADSADLVALYAAALVAVVTRDVLAIVLIGIIVPRRAVLVQIAVLLIVHVMGPQLLGQLDAPTNLAALLSLRLDGALSTLVSAGATALILGALLIRRVGRAATAPA